MNTLLHEGYFALFLIVALGMWLGQLEFRGISLDVSAVIFVALVFGHYGIKVPSDFQKIGLILFIYSVGLQSGSGFFDAFRKHGRTLLIMGAVIVGAGAGVTVLCCKLFGIDLHLGAGLLAGGLTSTPGLAAAIESTNSPLASIGYGVAYPFGVLGVIVFLRLLPKMLRADIPAAAADWEKESKAEYPEIFNANFVVENANINGQTIGDLGIATMTGARVSRVLHNGEAFTPNKDTRLHIGDRVKAVGTRKALDNVRVLVGKPTDEEIPLSQGYEVRWVLVTNKDIVGKTLGQLNLWMTHNATVTRIRRSGVDIAPNTSTALRFGDKLMIACDKDNLGRVARLLGNDERCLSETNFLPIALGIVLGVLLGSLEIPVGSFKFALGSTGGVLAAGLILSRLGKTGPVLWSMSGFSNQFMRELGLLFFLAAVGTEAGGHLVKVVTEGGWNLIVASLLIAVMPMVVATIIGHFFLRMNFLSLLGVIAGGMTSTPGLAAVDPMSDSDAPALAYATVYPFALVGMVVACQIVARL